MDHKIVTVCLMNSRGIHRTLKHLAVGAAVSSDRELAVVAALKLIEPIYQGVSAPVIFADLQLKSDADLFSLARAIHPVLCSLKLEKWLGVSGSCHYLAQSAAVSGAKAQRILLDGKAMDIPQPETLVQASTWAPAV